MVAANERIAVATKEEITGAATNEIGVAANNEIGVAVNEEIAVAADKAVAAQSQRSEGDKYASQIASLEGELREARDKGVAREAANEERVASLERALAASRPLEESRPQEESRPLEEELRAELAAVGAELAQSRFHPQRNTGTSIFLLKIWQGKILHMYHVPGLLCSNFVHIFKRQILVPG
jgi:hypothetical protein